MVLISLICTDLNVLRTSTQVMLLIINKCISTTLYLNNKCFNSLRIVTSVLCHMNIINTRVRQTGVDRVGPH